MNDWIFYLAIAFVVVIIVGNFSTFNRGANKPMRKQSLNDLKETLPRTNKTRHKMSTYGNHRHDNQITPEKTAGKNEKSAK